MMKVTINIFGLTIVISVSNSRNNVNTNFITIVNFNGNVHSNVYQDGLFMVTHTVESYQSNPFKTFYFYPKANILYRNLHSRAQKNCFVSFPLEIYTILVQKRQKSQIGRTTSPSISYVLSQFLIHMTELGIRCNLSFEKSIYRFAKQLQQITSGFELFNCCLLSVEKTFLISHEHK